MYYIHGYHFYNALLASHPPSVTHQKPIIFAPTNICTCAFLLRFELTNRVRCAGFVVSSPDAPPTRGKERLVTKLGAMTSRLECYLRARAYARI